MPWTAPGVRATMPMQTEIQHRHSAKPIASTHAARTWQTSVSARKPIDVAEAERDDDQHDVADDVAEHGADERRGPRDRQAAEAVEDALLDVGVEIDADRDAAEGDRLGEHAGEQELQVVVLRAAGDGAAEDVREQQDEDDRLERHVQQRLRVARDADQVALGSAAEWRARRIMRPLLGLGGGLACRWPVREKKTSSRLGSSSESSVTAMPASVRR